MEYTVDLFEPDGDLNASLEKLTQIFAPLYTESWLKEKAAKKPGITFDMNVSVFANMWFSKASKIFLVQDEMNKACGYLVGIVFRPMTHNVSVFQIEDWYCQDKSVEPQLFNHVYSVLKYMGVDEIQVQHSSRETYPVPHGIWHEGGETITTRYIKG